MYIHIHNPGTQEKIDGVRGRCFMNAGDDVCSLVRRVHERTRGRERGSDTGVNERRRKRRPRLRLLGFDTKKRRL